MEEIKKLAVGPEVGAEMIGVSRSKFFELLRDRAIPFYKDGRRTLVPVAELERYVAAKAAGRAA